MAIYGIENTRPSLLFYAACSQRAPRALDVADAVHLLAQQLGLLAGVVKGHGCQVDDDQLPAHNALALRNHREELLGQQLEHLAWRRKQKGRAREGVTHCVARSTAAEPELAWRCPCCVRTSEPMALQLSKTDQPSLSSGGTSLRGQCLGELGLEEGSARVGVAGKAWPRSLRCPTATHLVPLPVSNQRK